MKLSKRWLNDYVSIDVDNRDFFEALTLSGSKVEGWEQEGQDFSGVVIGKILRIEKHPDADKLLVCSIDIGKQDPLQVVTGAQNVFEGALVPVALDGATLPAGVKIKKGKLRGVESYGMLCSLKELGLTVGDFPYAIEDGIFIIEEPCNIGDDVHDALGLNDTVFDFEITSNRPDCLSIIGLAREVATTYQLPIRLPEPQVQGCGGDVRELLSVKVLNTQLCPRYTAKIIRNVKIAPSPRWMRERLRAQGVRSINNLVDITNFVMLEYGQPMHAFDLRYVTDNKIVVRNAVKGETITTLDGIERDLTPDMLVIADAKAPIAVAGVMGGEYSGIMPDTHTVVFESACFLGSSVRRTAQRLGMRTEASGRFEKDLDRQNTLPALLRACQLVEELGAGEVVDGVLDSDYSDKQPVSLKLDWQFINRFLGIDLSHEEICSYLKRAGFAVKDDTVTVPSYRTDIHHKADLAEEVARFYGYDRIPSTTIRGTAQGSLTERQKFEREVAQLMRARGLSEIMTYSFVSPKTLDRLCVPQDSPLRDPVRILNPLGEDTGIMRTTALSSMLETLSRNYNNRNLSAALYEVASEYQNRGADVLPIERDVLTLGMYGDNVDFFVLKGIVESLAEALHIGKLRFDPVCDCPSYHPGRCAAVYAGDTALGLLGEIHPTVLKNFELGTRAYCAALSMDALFAAGQTEILYHPLPKFPAIVRDLALVCDELLPAGKMEELIRTAVPRLLENITLFDVYRSEQLGDGKKSLAFKITLRSHQKTLTAEEADRAVAKILHALEEHGVTLR